MRGAAGGAAAARARAGRGAVRRGDARDLPGAARAATGRRGLERAGDRRSRFAHHLRRARRPGVRARAAAPDAQRLRGDRGGGHAALPLGRDGRRRAGRDRRRAAGRGRAVEFLDRVRRGADPEGVPARRARRQPRARAAALPVRARLPEHRRRWPAGTSTRAGSSTPRSASCRSTWRARATAGSWRSRRSVPTRRGCSTGCASSARSPASCTRRWGPTAAGRSSRPISRVRRRWRCWSPTSTSRSSGSSSTCRIPRPSRRSPAAGRTWARSCRRSRTCAPAGA